MKENLLPLLSCFLKWKKRLLLLFALGFPFSLYAQATWDSTYRPDIYRPRVQLFQLFSPSEEDIVFLGDSITFWGDWAELMQNGRIKNRGIPGDITFGVLERLQELVKGRPAALFILIGINDLARNIPDSTILENYRRMIRMVKTASPATRIHFQSLLPTNDSFHKLPNHCNKGPHIQKINAALRQLAADEQIVFIDLEPYFRDATGKLKKEYTWDGVHLTAQGYQQWKQILMDLPYFKNEPMHLKQLRQPK